MNLEKLKGQIKTLKVTFEDKNFEKVSQFFLKDIERNFQNYKKNYEKKYQSWENYLNSKNYIFKPEVLTKKSPLTLINAPWGTGKTFFIENFLKLNINKKFQSKIFQKMIIIDAWKYSHCKDVPLEFVEELTSLIIESKKSSETKDYKKIVKEGVLKKIFKKLLPNSLSIRFNLPIFSIDLNYSDLKKQKEPTKDEQDKIEELYKQISKNEQPTIIFIDNIERLGSHSWDLLKTLLKFQEFSNFLFILMTNFGALTKNFKSFNEYPIEKYINFNMYDFQQDYASFFKSKNINVNLIQKLEEIFNESINKEKLTIRELENSFGSHNILKNNDEYQIFQIIYNKIWPANKIKFFLSSDLDKYFSIQKARLNILNDNCSEFLERDSENNYLNIPKSYEEKIKLISWENEQRFYFDFSINYTEQFEILQKATKKSSQNIKKLTEGIEIDITKLSKKENYWNKLISKKTKTITNYDKKIGEESVKDDANANKMTKWKLTIENLNKNIESLENKLNDNQNEINLLNNKLSQIEQDHERIYVFSDGLIKNLKRLDTEEKELFSKIKLNYFKEAIIKSFDNDQNAGEKFENMETFDFKEEVINSLINEVFK